eukprot:CAMPEP_0198207626 /NCGR_PEP_ID=MMETSP1445-20131203/11064_1 /TAXON_ID=36898 /ORGANISM="Pyramimonas sp., Strain CCMP2087" /LENGTH=49 /DNA_ID= /DNA_START= /DNA_END= /DNA_ORIENTATION=
MEGGKKSSPGMQGRWWEWVTETRSDATLDVDRVTTSAPAPTASAAVQQL